MIRAVVCDLFHTLVDPEDYRPKDFRRAEALADLIGADRNEFAAYWEESAVKRYSTRRPSLEYVKDFLEKAGNAPSHQLLRQADEVIGRYQDLAILSPHRDVMHSLDVLKRRKVKIGLLSNAEEREVRSWPRSPLASLFDYVGFSYETGKLKPDSAAYQSALTGLGTKPAFCAYIGDGGSQELVGARKAKFGKVVFMRYFVARNGIHTDEELKEFAKQADIVIEDFRELPLRL